MLDEATSQLDAENGERVRRAVLALRGHATIVVISHRLAAVREADSVYVLEDGRVVECGNWPQLMARREGVLRRMVAAQGLVA